MARIHCSHCDSVLVYRYDHNFKGYGGFRWGLAFKDKFVDMTFNGTCVQDTARMLNVGINIAIWLKKRQLPEFYIVNSVR